LIAPVPTSLRPALDPLLVFLAVQTVITMAGLTIPVFAVRLAADLGISAGWVGLYMSCVFAVAMFSGVLGGGVVLRLGAIRVAQICLVAAGGALVLMTAGAVPWVVAAAMMIGFAYGPPTPASSHILARVTPPRYLPIVFSLKQTGVPVGGALAGALVPPMVILWGWRGAALAVAAACLVLAATLQPLRARFDADRDRSHRPGRDLAGPLRLVLRDPSMRRLAFLAGSFSAVQMAFVAYLVTFLVEAVQLDLVAAGAVLAVAQAAGIGGRILWGAVSGTLLSARWLLVLLGLAMAGASAAVAGFGPATPVSVLYTVAVLFGGSAIGWNGVMLAELARIAPPGLAGVATGGSIFVTFAGVVLSPALFSAILALGLGYAAGFWMLGALALVGAGFGFRHRVA
jgi:predicted MFS family arabinose efflux permease